MKSVKVLLLGAGGQVGRALLGSAPPGCEVIAPLRAELDLTNEQALSAAVRQHAPQVIVNAAAYTAVDRAEGERDAANRVNADGPRYLASAAGEIGARLIQISTDYVFDGTASVPYAPDAAPNPLNVYGASKLAGERAVLQSLGPHAVVLRTSWVYAALGSNFMLTMLRLMAAAGPVRVVSDQIGTPTSAASVAGATWAIAALPQLHGVHHWTDAGVASWYDFAVAIAEEASHLGLVPDRVAVCPIRTEDYPSPARRPRYSVLDTRSTAAALGLNPEHWRVRLRGVLRERAHA